MRRGLTLIELLVAVILCGIVVFIAVQVLRGEHKNYTVTREKVRLQSDAREGMRILEEEIKNTGYRTMTSINASYELATPTFCTDALYGTTGASFNPSPSASIYGTGTGNVNFEIRLFNPSEKIAFDCASNATATSDVYTIGYKYNKSTNTLYRQAKQGNPSVATNALNTSDWAPFLEGVTKFNVKYGVLQEKKTLMTPAQMAVSATPWTDWLWKDWVWGGDISWVDNAASMSSGNWVIQSKIGTPQTIVFIKLPLTSSGGGAADGARADALSDNATYRISFNVSANDAFFDDAKGLASVAGGPTSDKILGGFFDASGNAVSTFTFRPVKGGIDHFVQYDLVPAAASNQKVFFGIKFQLKAASAATRTMTISSLNIVRMNKGAYAFQATPPTDLKTVQALELQMTVQSKNETMNFDRIIPMVNNGL